METKLEYYTRSLQEYRDAESAILAGAQAYNIGTRGLTRANLKFIQDRITWLEKQLAIEESITSGNGRNKTLNVIPRDW